MTTSATSGKMVVQILLAALVVALAVAQVRIPGYPGGNGGARTDEDDMSRTGFDVSRKYEVENYDLTATLDGGASGNLRSGSHHDQSQRQLTFPPVPTTTTPSPPTPTPVITNTASASTMLDVVNASPCLVTRRAINWIRFATPSFPYLNDQECKMTLKTGSPQFMILKMTFYDVHSTDSVGYTTIFNTNRTFQNSDTDMIFVLPTTRTMFTFQSDGANTSMGFTIEILALTTDPICHQKIRVPVGASGTLTLPASPYKPDTFCEWWIETDDPCKKIQLQFTSFALDSACKDYLGVDTTGDPRYNANSTQYCNNTLPPTITSQFNKINVIFYGRLGNSTGFNATYTVV